MRRTMRAFDDCYKIGVRRDEDMMPFYQRLGITRLTRMAHRNQHATILDGNRYAPPVRPDLSSEMFVLVRGLSCRVHLFGVSWCPRRRLASAEHVRCSGPLLEVVN
jgi:hypothetical protein